MLKPYRHTRVFDNRPPDPKAKTIAAKMRSSKAWQVCRRSYVASHPLCEDPFGIHRAVPELKVTEEVHHKIPVETRPDLAFDEANLMACCRYCHEAMEKRGDSYV